MRRVLILGTGPASIQIAILLKKHMRCEVGIAGRTSVRSEPFFAALRQSRLSVRADIQNDKHRLLEGECAIDRIYEGYGTITGEWDTVIAAVTTDAYLEVLRQMPEACVRQVRCLVLLSPTFGSNSLVRSYMKERQVEAEIVSFSTYLGDTRWMRGQPSEHVITTAMKRKLSIGSTHTHSQAIEALSELYERIGIDTEVMQTPLEAESRNISLYVHPPLFMNAYALSAVFGESAHKTYVYKMFPEGPITQHVMRDMLAHWKEMTRLAGKLQISGVNLLRFMVDDNYPVRPESLSRTDIEQFMELAPIHQEYLLYVRYASLLIDPYSEPDEDGRYFDFSAVPIRQVFVNAGGEHEIPRMPKEDYYRIKIIQGIARFLGSSCPTIDKFIAVYERKLTEAAEALQGQRLSEAFAVRSFEEDLQLICRELEASCGKR
jgi:staphylopine/pseudopaline/yersinopine synthase